MEMIEHVDRNRTVLPDREGEIHLQGVENNRWQGQDIPADASPRDTPPELRRQRAGESAEQGIRVQGARRGVFNGLQPRTLLRHPSQALPGPQENHISLRAADYRRRHCAGAQAPPCPRDRKGRHRHLHLHARRGRRQLCGFFTPSPSMTKRRWQRPNEEEVDGKGHDKNKLYRTLLHRKQYYWQPSTFAEDMSYSGPQKRGGLAHQP